MTEALDEQEKERLPVGRKVVIHYVRHGEAVYAGEEDRDGALTTLGQEQADKIGEQIYHELPKGAVIEGLSSFRRRAIQTNQRIIDKIRQLENESDEPDKKGLIFRNPKVKTFAKLSVSDQHNDEYLDLVAQGKNPATFWLNHPGQTPQEIKENFNGFLRHLARFARQLSPTGPEVHLIVTIHTGPSEVFVGSLLGVSLIGSLKNCEQFTVELPVSGNAARIHYKNIDQDIAFPHE